MPDITSFPWTSSGSGTYTVQVNGSVPPNQKLFNVADSNVTILLNNHTLTWSGTGEWLDVNNRSNVTLQGPGVIQQGNDSFSGAAQTNCWLDGTGIVIDGITLNLKATPNVTSKRMFFRQQSAATATIKNSVIDITGDGPWFLLEECEGIKFFNNQVSIHDWDHSSFYYYARCFNECKNSEYYDNIILVASSAHITNLWIAWGDDGYNVHDNDVTFNCGWGRIFMADQGCDNWLVEDNNFVINSSVSGEAAVYCFRARVDQASSTASTNHTFRRNFVDTSGSSGDVTAVSLGDAGGVTSDILIDSNIFTGKGRCISHYGGPVSDVTVRCNDARGWTGTLLHGDDVNSWTYDENSWNAPGGGCWESAGPTGGGGASPSTRVLQKALSNASARPIVFPLDPAIARLRRQQPYLRHGLIEQQLQRRR